MADSGRGSTRRGSTGKKQGRKLSFRGFVVFVFFAVALFTTWAWWQSTPPSTSTQSVLVRIPPRSRSAVIASKLQEAGVIRNAQVFLWLARLDGYAGRFKPGEYRLSPSMTAREIMTHLSRGGVDGSDKSVTIPEGWTLKQIAAALETKGVIKDSSAFLTLVKRRDASLSAPFPLPEVGLEGYLFPDTYRFEPNSRPEKVAQAMLDRFTSAFFDKHRADVERSGHSLHEIVTIASLIEREAEVEKDRAKIAGVIENRLAKNMKLDIDATVLYALGYHKSRVYYKDLEVDSPYNTYRHKGLPPGPIASPGLASLTAALTPEKHDYLFYVASPDGSHIFTRSEAEHNAVVAKLRPKRHN